MSVGPRFARLKNRDQDALAGCIKPAWRRFSGTFNGISVRARSLLCFWATRELGMTTVDLAKKLNLAQPTVSQAAGRGQKIARYWGLRLL
jgi:hypothetical protein